MYNYIRTQTDDNSLEKYATLLSDVFTTTNKFSKSFLQWQYRDNPNGKVVGIDAFSGSELAGHYVCIPVKYNFYGKEILGLLSLNTAISPNHRGKGLFTKLAQKTYELAQIENYDFVIGVANQNSTHGFLKKLEFELIGPLDVFVGLGSIEIEKPAKIMPIWNAESIDWRVNNPSNILSVGHHFIKSKSDLPFVNIQMFKQKGLSGKNDKVGFTLWMGKSNKVKKKGIFINLPDRLKPSPLNLIFRSLNTDLEYNPKDISFECIDFDAY